MNENKKRTNPAEEPKKEDIREVIPALRHVPELQLGVADALLQELTLYRNGTPFNEK